MGASIRTAKHALAAAASLAVATIPALPASAASAPALSTPWSQQHESRVRLIAGPAAKDGVFVAGVEISMSDGWKTYWRMPGDSGVPPNFNWSGSTNVASVKVLYPAPQRLPEATGIAVGYKSSVLFPVHVTPKDAAKPVVLKLALEYGICREICIPAETTLAIDIGPGGSGALPAELTAALDRVPRPQASRRKTDPELKGVSVQATGRGERLSVEARFPQGPGGADLLIEAPDGLYIPLPVKASEGAGGIVRFTADLTPDLAHDLKGKALTLTLIGDRGATEAVWTHP
jgi:DsbC/DsbD-like thiol-disulfide interchange protein